MSTTCYDHLSQLSPSLFFERHDNIEYDRHQAVTPLPLHLIEVDDNDNQYSSRTTSTVSTAHSPLSICIDDEEDTLSDNNNHTTFIPQISPNFFVQPPFSLTGLSVDNISPFPQQVETPIEHIPLPSTISPHHQRKPKQFTFTETQRRSRRHSFDDILARSSTPVLARTVSLEEISCPAKIIKDSVFIITQPVIATVIVVDPIPVDISYEIVEKAAMEATNNNNEFSMDMLLKGDIDEKQAPSSSPPPLQQSYDEKIPDFQTTQPQQHQTPTTKKIQQRKRRGRPSKKVIIDDELTEDEIPVTKQESLKPIKPKNRRGRPPKKKIVVDDELTEDEEEVIIPLPPAKRVKKENVTIPIINHSSMYENVDNLISQYFGHKEFVTIIPSAHIDTWNLLRQDNNKKFVISAIHCGNNNWIQVLVDFQKQMVYFILCQATNTETDAAIHKCLVMTKKHHLKQNYYQASVEISYGCENMSSLLRLFYTISK